MRVLLRVSVVALFLAASLPLSSPALAAPALPENMLRRSPLPAPALCPFRAEFHRDYFEASILPEGSPLAKVIKRDAAFPCDAPVPGLATHKLSCNVTDVAGGGFAFVPISNKPDSTITSCTRSFRAALNRLPLPTLASFFPLRQSGTSPTLTLGHASGSVALGSTFWMYRLLTRPAPNSPPQNTTRSGCTVRPSALQKSFSVSRTTTVFPLAKFFCLAIRKVDSKRYTRQSAQIFRSQAYVPWRPSSRCRVTISVQRLGAQQTLVGRFTIFS
jgi:hypothetical protein